MFMKNRSVWNIHECFSARMAWLSKIRQKYYKSYIILYQITFGWVGHFFFYSTDYSKAHAHKIFLCMIRMIWFVYSEILGFQTDLVCVYNYCIYLHGCIHWDIPKYSICFRNNIFYLVMIRYILCHLHMCCPALTRRFKTLISFWNSLYLCEHAAA